jgi:hypothetical protein
VSAISTSNGRETGDPLPDPAIPPEVEVAYRKLFDGRPYSPVPNDVVEGWVDDLRRANMLHGLRMAAPEVALSLAQSGRKGVVDLAVARWISAMATALPPDQAEAMAAGLRPLLASHGEGRSTDGPVDEWVHLVLPHLSAEQVCGFIPRLISFLVASEQHDLVDRELVDWIREGRSCDGRAESGSALDQALWYFERSGEGDAVRAFVDRFVVAAAGDFVSQVNASPNGRTIVFVCTGLNYKLFRQALYLRKHGYRTFLVSLIAVPEAVGSTFSGAFERIVTLPMNFGILEAVLGHLRPSLFHVHCSMWRYALGRLVIEARADTPCVCELDDITSVYASRGAFYTNWPRESVDLDFEMEGFICRNADGLVHQFNPAVVELLRRRHGAVPPAIEMQPWPSREFVSYSDERYSSADGIVRIVYAGAVCPPTDANPAWLFPGRTLPEVIEKLLVQGFSVDVLLDPSKRGSTYENLDDPTWSIYRDLERRFELFTFRHGVPVERLASEIQKYDFGLVFLNFDLERQLVRPEKLKYQNANKLFAYLEAGLPVIGNAECETVAALIRENGIGIVETSDGITRIAEHIQRLDLDEMRRNVRSFNEKNNMESRGGEIIRLYENIFQNI